MDIQATLSSCFASLPGNLHLSLGVLFGSTARGDARQGSDVDIAVLSNHPLSTEERFLITESVGAVLKRTDIDLVDMWNATPLLAQNISEEGVCLFADTPSRWTEFRLRAFRAFIDAKPLFELTRKLLYV